MKSNQPHESAFAEMEEDDDDEDFLKIAELVPDMHHANVILKVFEIEAVVLQDPLLSDHAALSIGTGVNVSAFMNLGKSKANTLKQLIDQYKMSDGQHPMGHSGSGQKTRGSSMMPQKQSARDAQMVIQNFNKTILISLKAYDETAAIRVLLYSSKFLDLPIELIELINFTQQAKQGGKNVISQDDNHQYKNINKLIQQLSSNSVLSIVNASAVLMNNCVMKNSGPSPKTSQSLHLVMNLDNKYSKLQVYNKRSQQLPPQLNMFGSSNQPYQQQQQQHQKELATQKQFKSEEEEDENDLADFLGYMNPEDVRMLTGKTFQPQDSEGLAGEAPNGSSAMPSTPEQDMLYKQMASAAFVSNYELLIKQII